MLYFFFKKIVAVMKRENRREGKKMKNQSRVMDEF